MLKEGDMEMNRTPIILAVLAVFATASDAARPPDVPYGDGWMELVGSPTFLADGEFVGNYEYIYDVYGGATMDFYIGVFYFDPNQMVNVWYDPELTTVVQMWTSMSAGVGAPNNGYTEPARWPSNAVYDPATSTWVWEINDVDWGMLNEWHPPADYYNNEYQFGRGSSNITFYDDQIWFYNSVKSVSGARDGEDLAFTLRVVHPYGPGDMGYLLYGSGYSCGGTIVGPAVAPPEYPDGDVNRDTYVNVDDIDALCDFLRGEDPVTGYRYDLSDDGENANEGGGVVDLLDLDFLVHYAVETTAGTGTEYGDFNLDGMVDTTDLTRLATNYGADDWGWDDGNANRYIDTDIDNTDLTILATYYGFGEPDVVPEPATLSLLAIGAAGLLHRRQVH
jgi:hypothetical protein